MGWGMFSPGAGPDTWWDILQDQPWAGSRGFSRSMRGGPFLQRLSVLGEIRQTGMKSLENSRRHVD